MKHVRLAVGYADYGLASDLRISIKLGNGIPTHTPFCTSNVTWRFRLFISMSMWSAWSSTYE